MCDMLGIDAGLAALPASETRLGFLRHYATTSERRLALLRQQREEWFGGFPHRTALVGLTSRCS